MAIIGRDAWNRPAAQPINISVELDTDFSKASVTDNLKYSLNYAVISRNVLQFMQINQLRNFKSLQNIGEEISKIVLDPKQGGGKQGFVSIKSDKSEIRAESIEYKLRRSRKGPIGLDSINVNKLRLLTIIGVFTFERVKKQIVDIDLSLELLPCHNVQIHDIMNQIVDYVELSNFKTVEALELNIGQLILQNNGDDVNEVAVKVTKPNAISYTDGVGVKSVFTKDRFTNMAKIDVAKVKEVVEFNLPVETEISETNLHTVYIGFGSNQGDATKNINDALALLESYGNTIIATSSMYISKPMYVVDQPDFVNGVVKIQTKQSPSDLLELLKSIEYKSLGRVKHFANGPRSIDLDILLYDDATINTESLTVPHKLMLDRTFVLQPLCELIKPDFIHPISAEPIHDHLQQLLKTIPEESVQSSNKLVQIVPIPLVPIHKNCLVFDLIDKKSKMLIMGILNVTPDSFSDGGDNVEVEIALTNAMKLVEDGANIIDIGGVSTRPGSDEISEQEELSRIIPILKVIKSNEFFKDTLISIDTYRSEVARQCLEVGAHIINDVSMGMHDSKMFQVIAQYGCPYVLSHTRGNSKQMSEMTVYEDNVNEDIIEILTDPKTGVINQIENPQTRALLNSICREQALQLLKAFKAGVKKWQIILDPGIGFAKNLPQNLTILKHASLIKKYSMIVNEKHDRQVVDNYVSFNGLPTLVGVSRKKFLGTLNHETDPKHRDTSTNATTMVCLQQQIDIIRVHNTQETKKTLTIGEAIYKDQY